MAECKDCIHFEVCAYARHDIPVCDSFSISAVPVVRCRECKHWKRNLENDTYCSHADGLSDPEEHDFCSYGQRKEDEYHG